MVIDEFRGILQQKVHFFSDLPFFVWILGVKLAEKARFYRAFIPPFGEFSEGLPCACRSRLFTSPVKSARLARKARQIRPRVCFYTSPARR